MTVVLLLVVVLLAIWIGRNSLRIHNLEREVKRVRAPSIEEMPGPSVANTPIEPARSRFSFSNLLHFEETFGTNWLNKLGIVILVIGVALFLVYEVRELGPAGKVFVGYAVSAAMLSAGIFFERRERWRILARSGIGGGWALLYFTSYAMYHVPAAHVLASETLDLALLLVVAAGMVGHTLHYASQVVTGLAFLLAFTTINLSRGNASSLMASAILAAALAGIAVRRRWFEVEIAGMLAAYVNHYLWLRPIIEQMHVHVHGEPMHGHVHVFPGYVASAALLYSYWLIFRASYIMRTVPDRRGEIISTIVAVLNVGLFGWVMGYQSVHPELAFQFFLVVGAVEFILGQLPITRRRDAFIVLTTLGACLVAAAFPFRYSGEMLSASWLAIAECLLLAGVFLREIVYRRLGLAVALAAWIQMMAQVLERTAAAPRGLAVLFAVASLMFYIDSQFIPYHGGEAIGNRLDRLLFSHLAYLAGSLALIAAWIEWPGAWTVIAWAALLLVLMFIAWRSGRRIFLHQGMLLSFAILLRGIFCNMEERGDLRSVSVGITIALLLCALPLARALRLAEPGLEKRNPDLLFFLVAFILFTWLLAVELPSGITTLSWGVEAFVVFSVAMWLKERSYRLSALALLLLCIAKIVVRDVWGLAPRDRYLTFIVLGSALLAVSYLYTRYREALRQYL